MKIILLFVFFAIGVTIGGRVKRASGGRAITIDQAPYFVFLKRDGRHICGGALISTRHVLTAAGCVVDESLEYFYTTRVVSGVDTSDDTDVGSEIAKISPHGDYLNKIWFVNIAVITLSAPVESIGNQNKLSLPNAEPLYNRHVTLITHSLRRGDSKTSSLRRLDVNIHYSDPTYNDTYSYDGLFYVTLRSNHRVGRLDLGSPVVCGGEIIGIISTTLKLKPNAFYGISAFTFKTFITTSMGEEASLSSEPSSEIPAKRRRLSSSSESSSEISAKHRRL